MFGGVRRAVEAARADAEAAVWSRRDAEVTLAAEVAGDYIQLRALQRQIAVDRAEIARQQHLLTLVSDRSRVGVEPRFDIVRQTGQIADATARLAPLQAQVDVLVHALGVLLGEPPETLSAELATPATIAAPAAGGAGRPALGPPRRRPDVREAERQLAASNARIGAAVAERYPKFDLTGSADLVSTALKTLLSAASRQYMIAGAVDLPLLDGGKARADIGVATEQHRQAELAYRKAMLAACRTSRTPSPATSRPDAGGVAAPVARCGPDRPDRIAPALSRRPRRLLRRAAGRGGDPEWRGPTRPERRRRLPRPHRPLQGPRRRLDA